MFWIYVTTLNSKFYSKNVLLFFVVGRIVKREEWHQIVVQHSRRMSHPYVQLLAELYQILSR